MVAYERLLSVIYLFVSFIFVTVCIFVMQVQCNFKIYLHVINVLM